MRDSEHSDQADGSQFTAPTGEEVRQSLAASGDQGERTTPPHGIYIKDMRLYRGSAAPGIDTFPVADEDTIGRGVYLTSSSKAAASYAEIRADEVAGMPVLYETDIND